MTSLVRRPQDVSCGLRTAATCHGCRECTATEDMSCGYTTWPESMGHVLQHVLWVRELFCSNGTSFAATSVVLPSVDMSCGRSERRIVAGHFLWLQDMFCGRRTYRTYFVHAGHVLWRKDMSRGRRTCLVATRDIVYS